MKNITASLLDGLALTALGAAIFMVPACNTGDVPIGKNASSVVCSTNTDCQSGLCDQGKCAAVCSQTSDCPSGHSCVNSVCVSDTCHPSPELCNGLDDNCDGQVDNGATCGAGQTCTNGTCATGCTTNTDCASGETCVNGACQSSSQCGGPADCASGQSCVNGVCTACQPTPEICNGLDDDCDGQIDNGATCGAGKACVNGVCVASTSCTSNTDCTNGQVCYNQTCVDCSSVPEICNGIDDNCDGQIDNGAQCPNGQSCINGSCQ